MRGLETCIKGAVLVAAWLGLSASAFAQADPKVSYKVEAVPSSVTLSRPAGGPKDPALNTLAGYRVTLTNNAVNNLNRVYFRAVAINELGTDMVEWDSTTLPEGACSGFDSSTLNCQTDLSVPPYGGTLVFYVVARAPQNGSNIRIDWTLGGFEGNGGNNGCCGYSDFTKTTLTDPQTDPSYLTNVQSYVKKTGTTSIFTGDRFITRSNDKVASSVTVPGLSGGNLYDVGTITEVELSACPTGSKLTKCYESTINVPSVDFSLGETVTPSDFLTIVLRLDASAFSPKTKIEEIKLYYNNNPDPVVVLCGTTVPESYPCIIDRRILQPNDPDYTKDLKGDAQWKLRHYKNGTWRLL